MNLGGMPDDVVEWDAVCDKHGPFRAKGMLIDGKRRGGVCSACIGEREKADSIESEARTRAAKARRIAHLLGSSGIPPRFIGRTFENFRVGDGNTGQAGAAHATPATPIDKHSLSPEWPMLVTHGIPLHNVQINAVHLSPPFSFAFISALMTRSKNPPIRVFP